MREPKMKKPARSQRGARLWIQQYVGFILAPAWIAIVAFWISVTPAGVIEQPAYWISVFLWGGFGWWWFGDEQVPSRRTRVRHDLRGRWLVVAAALGFAWSLQVWSRSLIWAGLSFIGFFLAAMIKSIWVFGISSAT